MSNILERMISGRMICVEEDLQTMENTVGLLGDGQKEGMQFEAEDASFNTEYFTCRAEDIEPELNDTTPGEWNLRTTPKIPGFSNTLRPRRFDMNKLQNVIQSPSPQVVPSSTPITGTTTLEQAESSSNFVLSDSKEKGHSTSSSASGVTKGQKRKLTFSPNDTELTEPTTQSCGSGGSIQISPTAGKPSSTDQDSSGETSNKRMRFSAPSKSSIFPKVKYVVGKERKFRRRERSGRMNRQILNRINHLYVMGENILENILGVLHTNQNEIITKSFWTAETEAFVNHVKNSPKTFVDGAVTAILSPMAMNDSLYSIPEEQE